VFGMKGQWFIVSAVIASSGFLAISTLFSSYFIIDNSQIPRINEDFLFLNIQEELNRTIDYSTSDNIERNVKEFVEFSKNKMSEIGYYLEIINKTSILLSGTDYYLSLVSDRMNITRTVRLP